VSTKVSDQRGVGAELARRARVLAFYLPQFYPVAENDRWWGPGFTEWTNVVQARPLFEGHYQPRLPADVGFYDLRVPEVRELQAELASSHGIEAFCYWHYWFEGKRLLERPFAEVLSSGRPQLSFCLSWANETWSRRWHGSGTAPDVLQEQSYSGADDLAHIRWLMTAFADPRYVRIRGRPLFLVYRPFDLPDPRRTTDLFRSECIRHGLPEPYLLGINAHNPARDTRPVGFDSTLNFEPQLSAVPGANEPGLKIADYPAAVRAMRAQPRDYPHRPCVMVSWDNTPRRRDDGIVFINATPQTFGEGLQTVVDSLTSEPEDERLLFLNAWNEWAEGNHLEPDLKFGTGWLEAVRQAVAPSITPQKPVRESVARDTPVKPKLLFVHIPKTAGMAVYEALVRWATPELSLRFSVGNAEDRQRYQALSDEDIGGLRLLSGHLGYQWLRSKSLEGWDPVTVLREPVGRILSLYSYARGTEAHPWYPTVKLMTPDAFIDWLAEQPYYHDGQCQAISGSRDASAAFDILANSFHLACTVEHLPEFISVLSSYLGSPLGLEVRNTSPEQIDPDTLSPATLARIQSMNKQDEILYRMVRDRRLVGYGSPLPQK
jgi:hypothetical protein